MRRLPLTFLGIFLLGYTSQFIFDYPLGNITIKTCVGPFTYRTRHISKKQVLAIEVFEETAEGVTLWAENKGSADYIAHKIRAFVRSGLS